MKINEPLELVTFSAIPQYILRVQYEQNNPCDKGYLEMLSFCIVTQQMR